MCWSAVWGIWYLQFWTESTVPNMFITTNAIFPRRAFADKVPCSLSWQRTRDTLTKLCGNTRARVTWVVNFWNRNSMGKYRHVPPVPWFWPCWWFKAIVNLEHFSLHDLASFTTSPVYMESSKFQVSHLESNKPAGTVSQEYDCLFMKVEFISEGNWSKKYPTRQKWSRGFPGWVNSNIV